MCNDKLHAFLLDLPKIEHHCHLEGTLEPALLFDLASRNDITLPKDDPAFTSIDTLLSRYRRFTSLDDFLHYYFIGMSVLISAQDFEALAYAYFQKAHSQRVVHAEVFFDPQAHTSRGVAYETVVEGFTKAQKRAQEDFGLSSELIVCLLRHLSADECHEAYLQALPDLKSGAVRGLGLSSTEKGNPPSRFKQSYDDARSHGLRLTAHAGEEADVSYMKSAVDDLGCTRIDHGIKLKDDPDLMRRFARDKILLSICPLSNVELRCVKNVKELPIREYIDNGVHFSLNSDDPAYFGGYIQENYCAVQSAFELSIEEWAKIVTNSILGSWCSESRKDELLQSLSNMLASYA